MHAEELTTETEIREHLGWLRRAIRDPQVNTRLVFEGILDVLEARTVQFADVVVHTEARIVILHDMIDAADARIAELAALVDAKDKKK